METEGVHISTVAVDLIDTLVEFGGRQFITEGTEYLARMDCCIDPPIFRQLFRERYMEYTFGNYTADSEFLEVLAVDLPGIIDARALTGLITLRLNLSPALEGSTDFLQWLSNRYQVILASNFVGSWARHIISVNNWDKYFTATVVSSDIGFRKPGRRYFERLIQIANVSQPAEIAFIGDSYVNDIYGATSAGMRTILLDRGGRADRLDRGIVTDFPKKSLAITASSFSEIPSLLLKIEA